MQVSFACDLIFLTMNKFFHTLKEAITSGEISEQTFGYTGFIFSTHEYLCQILKK